MVTVLGFVAVLLVSILISFTVVTAIDFILLDGEMIEAWIRMFEYDPNLQIFLEDKKFIVIGECDGMSFYNTTGASECVSQDEIFDMIKEIRSK